MTKKNIFVLAKYILKIFSVCPHKLGGVRIEIPHFEYRRILINSLTSILPARMNISSIPCDVSSEHLVGGVDFLSSLREGRTIYQKGLLARNKSGSQILILNLTRDLDLRVSNLLSKELDKTIGKTNKKADGFNSLVVFEEQSFKGEDNNQKLPIAISERLALTILSNELAEDCNLENLMMTKQEVLSVANARKIFPEVSLDDAQLSILVGVSSELAVEGFRQIFYAISVAKAIAALDERIQVNDEDIKTAVSLVFFLKAKSLPPQEKGQESTEDEDTDSLDEGAPERNDNISDSDLLGDDLKKDKRLNSRNKSEQDEEESIDASIQNAVLSKKFLQTILASELSKRLNKNPLFGRGKTIARNTNSGKNFSSMRWKKGSPNKLKIIDSIQAALPYQVHRRTLQYSNKHILLHILPEDLRVSKRRNRVRNTTIFLVDASGSSAMRRLGEAKGAVELLLSECYIRRDEVALISFRGKRSDLLLEPTRSLVRAKKCLRGLKGGGGTPMSLALDHAFGLCSSELNQGKIPVLVILSDGGANVTKSGLGGRQEAFKESIQSAELFLRSSINSVFIDIADNPASQTKLLADKLGATYFALPRANSKKILDTVTTLR